MLKPYHVLAVVGVLLVLAAGYSLPSKPTDKTVVSLHRARDANGLTAVADIPGLPPNWTRVCLTDRAAELAAPGAKQQLLDTYYGFFDLSEENWWLVFWDDNQKTHAIELKERDLGILPVRALKGFKTSPPPIVQCAARKEAALASHEVSPGDRRLYLTTK